MVLLLADTPGWLPGCLLMAGEMLLYGKPFSPSPLVWSVCFHWACAARPGSLCPPVADRGCSRRLRCILWVHPSISCPHTSPFAQSVSFVAVICTLGLLLRVSPGHLMKSCKHVIRIACVVLNIANWSSWERKSPQGLFPHSEVQPNSHQEHPTASSFYEPRG